MIKYISLSFQVFFYNFKILNLFIFHTVYYISLISQFNFHIISISNLHNWQHFGQFLISLSIYIILSLPPLALAGLSANFL